VTNLCVNARDAMPHGGRLSIAATNQYLNVSQAALIQGLDPGPYVVLEVKDTGTGIPPGILSRIFDPFFTTKEPGKGTGLGLATAQGIVRGHAGRILVDSTVHQGTRFTIYLPARDAAVPEPVAPERRELVTGRGELILVIDDEAALLQIAKVTLTSGGYRVLTCQDGTEAAALYAQRSHEIQLVITDLVMPGMDGVATIQALQRLNPEVRIIVVSGLYPGAEAGQAAVAGIQGFLSKPYTVEAMLTTVRNVLDAQPAGSQEASGANSGAV
jgi:CheY-like chemotaxis protein